MNQAIDCAYREGDDSKLDALLTTKLILAKQEATPAQKAHHGR